LAWTWGNSFGAYYFSLRTRRVRYIVGANSLQVIQKCRAQHVGRLILMRHTLYGPMNYFGDAHQLVDDAGRSHGMIGPSDDYVDRFLANVCGIGVAPPSAKFDGLPPALRRGVVRCQDGCWLTYRPEHMLDGTEFPLAISTCPEGKSVSRHVVGIEFLRSLGSDCAELGQP
jgi:hypothetical protein